PVLPRVGRRDALDRRATRFTRRRLSSRRRSARSTRGKRAFRCTFGEGLVHVHRRERHAGQSAPLGGAESAFLGTSGVFRLGHEIPRGPILGHVWCTSGAEPPPRAGGWSLFRVPGGP